MSRNENIHHKKEIMHSFYQHKLFVILSFLVFQAMAVNAQDISAANFLWTVNSARAQADTTSFSFACTFTTYNSANNTLDWSQNNGQSISHFTVTSVEGQWTDISKDGQVIYHVEKGKLSGTIVFQKSGSVPSVHLQLFVNGNPDQDYIFSVSAVNQLN